jgi:hypothetical protein
MVWSLVMVGAPHRRAAAGAVSPTSARDRGMGGLGQAVMRIKTVPVALADNTRTGRIFVEAGSPSAGALVVMLDAASGRLLATIALSAASPAGTGHGAPRPTDVTNSANIAVDGQSNRVFVLSNGPFDTKKHADVGSPMVFMLDGTTGRVLHAATLNVGLASKVYPNSMLVDARANREFVGYGSINQMSVLDATTGQVLGTLRLGAGRGVTPLPLVLPLDLAD